MILDAMPAGQPWLFGLLLWRTALRQAEALNLEWRDLQFGGGQPSVTVRNGKGGRYRVVPAHPEMVDAFRSVPHRSLGEKVFTGRAGKPMSPRTAARWISEGITTRYQISMRQQATGRTNCRYSSEVPTFLPPVIKDTSNALCRWDQLTTPKRERLTLDPPQTAGAITPDFFGESILPKPTDTIYLRLRQTFHQQPLPIRKRHQPQNLFLGVGIGYLVRQHLPVGGIRRTVNLSVGIPNPASDQGTPAVQKSFSTVTFNPESGSRPDIVVGSSNSGSVVISALPFTRTFRSCPGQRTAAGHQRFARCFATSPPGYYPDGQEVAASCHPAPWRTLTDRGWVMRLPDRWHRWNSARKTATG